MREHVRKVLISRPQASAIAPRLPSRNIGYLFQVRRCVVSIIGWIILGLLAGFIASKIVNKTGVGFFLDLVLGIVGALVGGVIFSALGASGITRLNLYSVIVAVNRAVVVWSIYHKVTTRRRAF